MAIVAVAGGTGDVGRTIVEALVDSRKHKVFVLARKAPAAQPGPDDAQFVVVDYNDIDSLAKALDANKVDTVISTLSMEGPGPQAQLNLIAAAGKSITAKRFIPSEFAGLPEDQDTMAGEYMAALTGAVDAIKKAGLTYTRVMNGIFMDYFGLPHVSSHLRPFKWALDIPGRRAALPGTGDDLISMTYSKDVARFVAALVGQDEWPEYSLISGSDASLNHIVALVEKALGVKLDVVYDSVEDLKAGKATDLFPGAETYGGADTVTMAAYLGLTVAEGKMVLPKEGRLNDRFPEIKPKSVDELVAEAWTGK